MKLSKDKSKSDKFFDAVFDFIVGFCAIATVVIYTIGLWMLFK